MGEDWRDKGDKGDGGCEGCWERKRNHNDNSCYSFVIIIFFDYTLSLINKLKK